jgi:hypothetical protein
MWREGVWLRGDRKSETAYLYKELDNFCLHGTAESYALY